MTGPAEEPPGGGLGVGHHEPGRLPEVRHLRGGDPGREHGGVQALRPVRGEVPRAAGEVRLQQRDGAAGPVRLHQGRPGGQRVLRAV